MNKIILSFEGFYFSTSAKPYSATNLGTNCMLGQVCLGYKYSSRPWTGWKW